MTKSVGALENEAPYAIKDKHGAKYDTRHKPHLELPRNIDSVMLIKCDQFVVFISSKSLVIVKVALMIIGVIPGVNEAARHGDASHQKDTHTCAPCRVLLLLNTPAQGCFLSP